MTELSLASEFAPANREQWMGLVERVLKGADFDRKLASRTSDGLKIEPIYPKADGAGLVRKAEHGPWRVSGRLDHPDPATANALGVEDLEGGADALALVFAGAPTSRGFGLRAETVGELDRALAGIMLDLISVRVEAGPGGALAAGLFLELARRRGHNPAVLDLDLGLDPVAAMAATGLGGWPEVRATLADLAANNAGGRWLLADGRPYHEGGGSEAQELAATLATGVAYLRLLEAEGVDLDRARDAISFLLVADADQFLTVAKLRALRSLWARVEVACGLETRPLRLHAETAWRMNTRRDPWVNLLRGTVAAFSAGIGGADVVTVLPFTSALGLPDAFARRLARNTQLLLLEEANVWRVEDPVAGAGGFEALSSALAEEAWSQFGRIEKEGGIVESLRSNFLQTRIAETRARRATDAATRRAPITGTSEFPNIHEQSVAVLMHAPPPSGPVATEPGLVPPLPSVRTAEPFEELRDRSDAILAASGRRPRVYLANLGPIAAFSARATFAKNAFESVGVEAVTNDGHPSIEETVAEFTRSGARIACLCSSDEIYAAEAEPAARALRGAGAEILCLAGRPGEPEERLRTAGIERFVFAGSDLVGTLGDLVA